METVNLPVGLLCQARWNPNQGDEGLSRRLRGSFERYGSVENLVVRPLGNGSYEVLSGNQRLKVFREMGYEEVPCVVVEVDDAEARLLVQALNHIHGEMIWG